MRWPALVAFACAALAGCNEPTHPGSRLLSSAYFLSTLDGNPLPTSSDELPEGHVLVASHLDFSAITLSEGLHGATSPPEPQESGLVEYRQVVRDPQGVEQLSQINLLYTVDRGELRINLCPPLALCIAPTELIGPADRDVLVLTHYLADQPRAAYRFIADLPD